MENIFLKITPDWQAAYSDLSKAIELLAPLRDQQFGITFSEFGIFSEPGLTLDKVSFGWDGGDDHGGLDFIVHFQDNAAFEAALTLRDANDQDIPHPSIAELVQEAIDGLPLFALELLGVLNPGLELPQNEEPPRHVDNPYLINGLPMHGLPIGSVYPSETPTVFCLDSETDTRYGGAHVYRLQNHLGYNPEKKEVEIGQLSQLLQFCKKEEGGEVVPGVFTEQLLIVAIDRTRKLGAAFPDPNNVEALQHLEAALNCFKARVDRRVAAGVMGKLENVPVETDDDAVDGPKDKKPSFYELGESPVETPFSKLINFLASLHTNMGLSAGNGVAYVSVHEWKGDCRVFFGHTSPYQGPSLWFQVIVREGRAVGYNLEVDDKRTKLTDNYEAQLMQLAWNNLPLITTITSQFGESVQAFIREVDPEGFAAQQGKRHPDFA